MHKLSSLPEKINSFNAPATILFWVSHACSSKSHMLSSSHPSWSAISWITEEGQKQNDLNIIMKSIPLSSYLTNGLQIQNFYWERAEKGRRQRQRERKSSSLPAREGDDAFGLCSSFHLTSSHHLIQFQWNYSQQSCLAHPAWQNK